MTSDRNYTVQCIYIELGRSPFIFRSATFHCCWNRGSTHSSSKSFHFRIHTVVERLAQAPPSGRLWVQIPGITRELFLSLRGWIPFCSAWVIIKRRVCFLRVAPLQISSSDNLGEFSSGGFPQGCFLRELSSGRFPRGVASGLLIRNLNI